MKAKRSKGNKSGVISMTRKGDLVIIVATDTYRQLRSKRIRSPPKFSKGTYTIDHKLALKGSGTEPTIK